MNTTKYLSKFLPLRGLALILAVVFLSAAQGESDDEMVGQVTAIKGNAVAIQDALPRPLKIGATILLNDVISTGKGAKVELKMSDNAVFSLGPRTSFVVEEYFLTGETGSGVVRLLDGAVKVISGQIAQLSNKPFKLNTAVATIGVRGTTFWGGKLDGVNQFALLDGAGITVTNQAGSVEITAVGQGTSVADGTTAPIAPRAWGPSKMARASELTNAR